MAKRKNKKMTSKTTKITKTKLSILGIGLIAGIFAVGSFGVFNPTNNVAVEPSNVSKPYEIPFYQGVQKREKIRNKQIYFILYEKEYSRRKKYKNLR